ncbi:MAG: methyltransferase domain-containing protein [Herpetosiphonaceae bacterium]|nr:methyltransferase domain-containing protein [Herpetosiphonaceae bacterium]
MTGIFVLTTRGLEGVSAAELQALPQVTVDELAYRRVLVQCAEPLDGLLQLRTVDDVFVQAATWQGIGRPRSTLPTLVQLAGDLDLRPAAAVCSQLRPLATPPTFSVTASFVGKRNYSTEEIKLALAEGLEGFHGWEYRSDDAEADLNVRIFLDHEQAVVGVRLGKTPLHERPYKQIHIPGSLKPPVAAALLALAEIKPGLRVLDPCCGGGTIVIEAALAGASAQGGDNDPAAVQAAQSNAQAAGITPMIERWDAQSLPLADASIDCIVSNLPWGRQIILDAALATFYRRVLGEMRRVLVPGGRIVVLSGTPDLINLPALQRVAEIEISLFGQTPTVIVLQAV